MSEESITSPTPTEENRGGIFDILGKIMSTQTQATATEASTAPEKPVADLGALSSILSNPELIAKLPELISIISPLMSSFANSGSASAHQNGAIPASAKPSSPISISPQNRELQNRSALLCALKPYLKKERQDAIDYMIKLSRLGDILKTL